MIAPHPPVTTESKVGVLYKLTFCNGKSYIGVTTQSFAARFAYHKWRSKQKNSKFLVYKAWNKYGEPSWEILAVVNVCDLYSSEIRAIAAYGTYGKCGYNSTPGGESSPMLRPEIVDKVKKLASTPERIARNIEIHLGSKRTEASKKMMSDMRKGQGRGIPKSESHKANISKALKGRPLCLGRKHSEETRAKMSESAKLRWAKRASK